MRIKSSKWLLYSSYSPNNLQNLSPFQELPNGINTYCHKYKKILLMGDFNVDFKRIKFFGS